MTIFDRIAQTRQSFAMLNDYDQETLAYEHILMDFDDWVRLMKIRNIGRNRNLISESEADIINRLLCDTRENFNHQPIPVRVAVIESLRKTETILVHHNYI